LTAVFGQIFGNVVKTIRVATKEETDHFVAVKGIRALEA
jgi:hypothetical protein